MTPLLEARDIDIDVPGRRLVTGLTLALRPGTTTVLLGPNGSGKSLCLLTLAGLRPRRAGTLRIGAQPVEALTRREVASLMGFMPQDSGNEVVGTVRDFARLGLYAGTDAAPSAGDETVDEALRHLALAALAHQDVTSLSGGERRRLDLALLRVQGARPWLLDEPTNHLDPAQQAILLGLLRGHCARGGAALISLHDPSLAADIADQVVLLHGDGRWQAGTTQDLLTPPLVSALYRTEMTLAMRFSAVAR